MYANYAVWDGGLGGLEDGFFLVGWVSPTGRGKFFLREGESYSTV